MIEQVHIEYGMLLLLMIVSVIDYVQWLAQRFVDAVVSAWCVLDIRIFYCNRISSYRVRIYIYDT